MSTTDIHELNFSLLQSTNLIHKISDIDWYNISKNPNLTMLDIEQNISCPWYTMELVLCRTRSGNNT